MAKKLTVADADKFAEETKNCKIYKKFKDKYDGKIPHPGDKEYPAYVKMGNRVTKALARIAEKYLKYS